MKYNTYEIDISRKIDPDDGFTATLRLKTVVGIRSAEGALALFRKTIIKWLKVTRNGNWSWVETVGKFNYGDLDTVREWYKPEINKLLAEVGIVEYTITEKTTCDCGEHWDRVFQEDENDDE